MVAHLRKICSILFLIVFISTTIFTSAEAGVCGKDKIPNTDEINQGMRLRCGPGWLMKSYVKGFARLNMGEVEKNKLFEELGSKNLEKSTQGQETNEIDSENFGIKGPRRISDNNNAIISVCGDIDGDGAVDEKDIEIALTVLFKQNKVDLPQVAGSIVQQLLSHDGVDLVDYYGTFQSKMQILRVIYARVGTSNGSFINKRGYTYDINADMNSDGNINFSDVFLMIDMHPEHNKLYSLLPKFIGLWETRLFTDNTDFDFDGDGMTTFVPDFAAFALFFGWKDTRPDLENIYKHKKLNDHNLYMPFNLQKPLNSDSENHRNSDSGLNITLADLNNRNTFLQNDDNNPFSFLDKDIPSQYHEGVQEELEGFFIDNMHIGLFEIIVEAGNSFKDIAENFQGEENGKESKDVLLEIAEFIAEDKTAEKQEAFEKVLTLLIMAEALKEILEGTKFPEFVKELGGILLSYEGSCKKPLGEIKEAYEDLWKLLAGNVEDHIPGGNIRMKIEIINSKLEDLRKKAKAELKPNEIRALEIADNRLKSAIKAYMIKTEEIAMKWNEIQEAFNEAVRDIPVQNAGAYISITKDSTKALIIPKPRNVLSDIGDKENAEENKV